MKQKLTLAEIKVNSFITTLKNKHPHLINGGISNCDESYSCTQNPVSNAGCGGSGSYGCPSTGESENIQKCDPESMSACELG